MTNLENIKKSFYSNGFVHVEKLFSRDEIRQVLKEIEKLKKFTKIKTKICTSLKIKNLILFMI